MMERVREPTLGVENARVVEERWGEDVFLVKFWGTFQARFQARFNCFQRSSRMVLINAGIGVPGMGLLIYVDDLWERLRELLGHLWTACLVMC